MVERVACWGRLWGAPELAGEVRVSFSRRMASTLGRCFPARAEIRLSERLRGELGELLEETLCHELAHFLVRRRHGPKARPHGKEWQELVERAGFLARTHVERVVKEPPRRPVYRHRCPVCGASRSARRRMPGWRCAECVEAGLEGRLEVVTR